MPNQSNLGTFTALYSSPHTSHRRNFPPVEYRDLTRADISLLAPILAVDPIEENSPNQTTKHHISQLPSHLLATIPWLSTFCPHHRKLNSLPIISLWNAMRDEVLRELATVWTNVDLSPAHAHFIDRVRHFPRFNQKPHRGRCAACSLASMAGDNDLLIAAGAVMSATLSQRNWRKSKRALFLQGMLGGRVSASHAEGPVVKMLQLAAEWREIRCSFWESRCGEVGQGLGATEMGGGCPRRPNRDVRQDGHVATVLNSVGDDEGSAGPAHYPERSRDHRDGSWKVEGTSQSRVMSRPPAVPAKPTPHPSPDPSRHEDLPPNPGASSSVYSVDEAEEATPIDASRPPLPASAPAAAASAHSSSTSAREAPPSICGESTIINLYRHSVFPPSPAPSSSPPSSIHSPANPSPPNQETQHVESSHNSRHSLAPIWIPRPYYYYGGGGGEAEGRWDEEPAPVTSALWRRRTGRFDTPHSPAGPAMGPGKAGKASEDYDERDAEEEGGHVRDEDVVVAVGVKADTCWVPGMAAGRWI
ncbi:hypothetical protein KC360_g5106 [Hortaea werneckii]|nr:hypothetical protein KC325_g5225 [Hortaea werneckii]KAI6992052.1 hypothetical protein KC359_g5874 [Hortaea werneckii]KAI7144554.1 hypothetical protein KC344_g5276 [Hortaea werneckii]KAI7173096.1 hypothetical protein KC360_g5106 [Hortaea werneckii]